MKPTDKQIKQFYDSQAWQRLRDLKLSLNPLCEACAMSGIVVPGVVVHHLLSVRAHWGQRFNLKLLISLCAACHTRIEDEVRQQLKMNMKGGGG